MPLLGRRVSHLLICFVVVRGVSSGRAESQCGDVVATYKTGGNDCLQRGYEQSENDPHSGGCLADLCIFLLETSQSPPPLACGGRPAPLPEPELALWTAGSVLRRHLEGRGGIFGQTKEVAAFKKKC